ncbi:MAG TPA: helix-turn-helix domain-containing protein [Candidatus Limnocylindrales bacterium]|nr:helix-turn-helix domain-containing protein [Candidatus Limnocylindrales bacterium]
MQDPSGSNAVTYTEILAAGELGRLVRERRERSGLSVRQAAQAADVSFMTVTRVEEGNQPDLVTFMKLCAWLGRPPSSFFRPVAERPVDHLEKALQHLAADPNLDNTAADRITSLVRDMYAVLARPLQPVAALDMHLRAAPVMRPGVPERLASILTDMRQALTQKIDKGAL